MPRSRKTKWLVGGVMVAVLLAVAVMASSRAGNAASGGMIGASSYLWQRALAAVGFPATHPYQWPNPTKVDSITSEGIMLEDGREIALPNMDLFADHPRLINEATMRGVKLGPEGEVIGLLRVSSGCGNSMWSYYMETVDLRQLLTF